MKSFFLTILIHLFLGLANVKAQAREANTAVISADWNKPANHYEIKSTANQLPKLSPHKQMNPPENSVTNPDAPKNSVAKKDTKSEGIVNQEQLVANEAKNNSTTSAATPITKSQAVPTPKRLKPVLINK